MKKSFTMLEIIISISILFIVILSFIGFAQQEQITITTYYPSPYGSYHTLQVINNQQEILMGNDSSNTGMEMRSRNGNSAYIDFSNDATSNYDMRIQLDSNYTNSPLVFITQWSTQTTGDYSSWGTFEPGVRFRDSGGSSWGVVAGRDFIVCQD